MPGSIKVLLVEDNPDIALLIQEFLKKAVGIDFQVKHCADFKTALEEAAKKNIDVILLDLNLPGSSGLETFSRMHGQVEGIPIIVLTGMDDEGLATRAVREGAQDYLAKSEVNADILVRSIKYAIERKRIEEELRRAHDGLELKVRERTAELVEANEHLKVEIEERRKAEEKLREAYTELKETQNQLIQAAKLEVVGRLASGVAHEVKNPLSVILQGVDYFVDTLQNKDENTESLLEYMRRSVYKADAIVRGLLDFSSISKLDMVPCDIVSVLESSLMLVKHELDKHHIRVRRDFKDGVGNVVMDKNRVEQVFVNLLMNAINVMDGGGEITLKVYGAGREEFTAGQDKKAGDVANPESGAVVVEIEDTGPGIPEKIMDKIFDPFFTTRRNSGGSGLGLSVVKNIIDLHEGKVSIKNKEGRGVKVTIMFPQKGGQV